MSDNIKVAIKVRPLIERERDQELQVQWSIEDNKITEIDPESQKKGETEYTFDYIFDQGSTNEEVFDATVKPVVEAAMQGFNGTIFAYGQTSSGKTYTMMGTKAEPGVIPLAVASIFDYIKKDQTREFVLSVSYLEIYNERINDLLNPEQKDLKIREENGEIKVECKEEVTHSVDDILHVMKRGDKNRRIGETNMNEKSSRSHTIFKITIGSVLRSNRDGDAIVAQLNLIDLAGSERANQTGATGERFNEGKHINKSLYTLGLVIKQLSENTDTKSKLHKHISYRDSKLTRILQPSLGGNSLTTIICAITPAAGDETICTLAFAQRAKGIKNKPKVNETGSDKALVKRFRKQIHKLEENLKLMSDQLRAKDEKLQDVEVLKGRIELLKTKILSGHADGQGESKKKNLGNRRRTWGGSEGGTGSPGFDFQLPTIQECDVEEKADSREYIKRRQSVFQNVPLAQDDSFSTDWEDFELQLIKDEQNKMARWSNDSVDPDFVLNLMRSKEARQVTFEEDTKQAGKSDDCCTTPEKNQNDSHSSSPGTPKSHLRESLKTIQSRYHELREYTTLEKQIHKDSSSTAESSLAFMQKSLIDSEQVCRDLSKKYAELQSEHTILKRNYEASSSHCENLEKQVEILTITCEKLETIESERDVLKCKFDETVRKLKILEDETSSHAYAMELTAQKYKARESELEASLNSAWEELNSYRQDDKNNVHDGKQKEIDKLQLLVDELTGKIELSNCEREKIQENYEKIILEKDEGNENLKKIISDLSLRVENFDKIISEKDRELKLMEEKIELLNFEKSEIKENYERIISEKDLQLSEHSSLLEKLKSMEEKLDLFNFEKEETAQAHSKTILELSLKIENYEKAISEKDLEIQELSDKICVQEDQSESDKMTEEIKRLENVLSDKTKELEKLAQNLENQIDNENDLKSRINELELKLQKENNEVIELDKLKNELLKEIEELKMRRPNELSMSKINMTSSEKTILDNETSSIFGNGGYFDSSCMEASSAPIDSVLANSLINNSVSISIIENDKSILEELETKTRDELLTITRTIENDNKKLINDYKIKIRETEEIKNYILGIKVDMESLQRTVLLLTNENAELTLKLTQEKEQLSKIIHENNDYSKLTDKMNLLTAENHQMSEDLLDKIQKIEALEKENIDLSNNLMERIEEYEGIIGKLRESIEDKSKACKTCSQLSDLMETRRALKLDVKTADKKLQDLSEDFQRKSADVEKLQTKVKEDFNISSIFNDTIFNGSICDVDGADAVVYVEEKVEKLHTELDGLKTNYEQLTILYQEKCNEIETLRDEDKLLKVREELQRHQEDLHGVKKYIDRVMSALEKFRMEKSKIEVEMNSLRADKEETMEKLNEERKASLEKMKNLEEIIDDLRRQVESSNDNRQIQELEEARDHIKKEIISLKPEIVIDKSQVNSVIELFRLFINTIMRKEEEIIKSLQLANKRERERLEEEKKQFADAEKRSVIWARELESDIERLQSELGGQEKKNLTLDEEISRLRNSLRECEHEKKLLEEKVCVMESDFMVLQADLDKYTKIQSPNESKSLISQEEVERIMNEVVLNNNLENSVKIERIEARHKLKIEEFENLVESLRTKNLELRNTIEGLNANESNLKSIIDIKTIECEKSASGIDKLEDKLKELNYNYDNLVEENRKNLDKVEEITRLLKTKCDKLSEYKTLLETMKPDYEMLKDESSENKERLEKYKTEIEYLREENNKLMLSLSEIGDNFENEKIKSAGLSKQLAELQNKNILIQSNFDKLQEKYDEIFNENESLNRKIRNSTSKLTAERDIEDLKDEINTLRKNFDGASNRILELQLLKTQLTADNNELKLKNQELLSSLSDYENKKIIHPELSLKYNELMNENEKLKIENKELNNEMDEIVERMTDMDRENGRLETELYEYKCRKNIVNDDANVSDDYKKLKKDNECLTMKCELLTKENVELKSKIKDTNADSVNQSRSTSSSRSTSPIPSASLRRKRRSDLFNQNRPQELAQEFVVAEEIPCNCDEFRNTIAQLKHEIVLKKGKITALEMKIESACEPFKKNCRDYEERLATNKITMQNLRAELKRLQESQVRTSNCERCKNWRENRRDLAIQCMPQAQGVTGFMAPKSGVVQDQQLIEKLEKEKAKLKELCSSRCHEIKGFLKKIKELEWKLSIHENSEVAHSNSNDETKENVPVNILGPSKSISPANHFRS